MNGCDSQKAILSWLLRGLRAAFCPGYFVSMHSSVLKYFTPVLKVVTPRIACNDQTIHRPVFAAVTTHAKSIYLILPILPGFRFFWIPVISSKLF